MRYFIPIIGFIFIFSACKDNSQNNLTVYKIAEEGLHRSNKNISEATGKMFRELKDKAEDFKLREVANVWQPKAIKIKMFSDSIIKFIEGLKEELKNEAGGGDYKDWGSNLTVANHVFESHGRGKELFEKLILYRNNILSVDPYLNDVFGNKVNVFTEGFDYELKGTAEFVKNYFDNVTLIAAFVVLSRFENNIRICENEFVTFCYNRIGVIDDGSMFHHISVLTGQNSNYLKAGDELIITAGIGAFSSTVNAKLTINNINIPFQEGMAEYSLKVTQKPGKHTVPVTIDYIGEDGSKRHVLKTVTYTVME